MSEDLDRSRRGAAVVPEAVVPAAPADDELEEGPFSADGIEDTVPYLPPLASYPIQIKITEISRGVPHIYPDEILDEHE